MYICICIYTRLFAILATSAGKNVAKYYAKFAHTMRIPGLDEDPLPDCLPGC